MVSGIAATGSGVSGQIFIKDVNGQQKFVNTTDGSFNLVVDGLTAPYLLKAQWTAGGNTQELYGFATGAGNVDITPLTNLAVTAAAGNLSLDAVWTAPGAAAYNAIGAALPAAAAQLQNDLGPLLAQFSIPDFDLLSGTFTADHTGMDALLDSITVTISSGESVVANASSGATILDAPSADLALALTMPAWTAQDAAIANDPDVAVDTSGNGLVVWANSVLGNNAIQAWFITQPGSSVVTVNTTAAICINPRVAFDASGNAIVVWGQANASNGNDIWARRYVAASQTWSMPVQLSAATTAQTGAGNAVVVWAQFNGVNSDDSDEWYVAYGAGSGTWSAPALVSDGVNASYGGHVAVNAAGHGIVVWQQEQGNGSVSNAPTDVWARRFTIGGAWGVAGSINAIPATTASVYGQIAVAMDSAGNGAALWVQGTIQAAMLSAANGWQASSSIMSVGSDSAYGPRVAFDGGGNALAVWQEQNGVSAFGGTNRYVAGTGWGTSGQLAAAGQGDVYLPRVAVDNAGNATAVWYQVVLGNSAQVFSDRFLVASGWGTPQLLSPTTTDGFTTNPVPVVATNASGQTVAVWGIDSN